MNIKGFLHMLVFLSLTCACFAQRPIDLSAKSPKLQGYPLFRMIEFQNDAVYIGGNIAFHNGKEVSPIIKLNVLGGLDETFNPQIPYTNDFFNDLNNGHAIWNESIYFIHDRSIVKVDGDSPVESDETTNGLTNVTGISLHRDSLLVVTAQKSITLVGPDGGTRVLEEEQSESISYLDVIFISSEAFVLLKYNFQESKGELILYQNGEKSVDFSPVITNSTLAPHIEKLPNGELLFAGNNLVVNGVTGNGVYIVTETGELSDESFHNADWSFIDRILTATPDGEGNYFLVGRSSNSQNVIAKVLSTGLRDDLFDLRHYDKINAFVFDSKLVKLGDNRWLLADEQTAYGGNPANGLTLIDIDGNAVSEFATLGSYAFVSNFRPMAGGDYSIEGRQIANSATGASGLVTWSLAEGPTVPDFGFALNPANGVGSSLLLTNGDFLVSYDDSEDGRQFEVYRDGALLDIPISIRPNTSSGLGAITDMHETSDGGVLLTGYFNYQIDNAFTRTGAIKLNSNYEIDISYSFPDLRVYQSDLLDQDRIILAHNNEGNSAKITRLLADGSEDPSFENITIESVFSFAPYFFINESRILVPESDFNNTQIIKSFDQNGSLINSSLFTMNADRVILDMEQISDTTILVAGSFDEINLIERNALALIHLETGNLYDDLNLNLEGRVDQMAIENDTLILLGPASIDGVNTGGFNAIDLTGPKEVIITSISNDEAGLITISWESDLQTRNFEIIRSFMDEVDTLATLERGSSDYVDESATTNQRYTYTVVSSNLLGKASSSMEYMIVEPQAPSNLIAGWEEEAIELNWEDNSDNEVGFEILRTVDDGSALSIGTIGSNEVSFRDLDVQFDQSYTYTVRAVSENFVSQESNVAVVDIILNLDPFKEISIYPNPTNGRVFINRHLVVDKIQVLDFSGKILIEVLGDQRSLDLSGLVPGVYLLQTYQKDQISTYRLIKEDY